MKSDYENVAKKLEETTLDLEVERRLRPQLETMEREKDLLKQTHEGCKKSYEVTCKDFKHYQASHLAGASMVHQCITWVFESFGIPAPDLDLEGCSIE